MDQNAQFCPKCGARVSALPASSFVEVKSAGLAAVLSFFIPGLGQIYNGQIGKGIIFIVLTFVFAATIIVFIGFILLPLFWIYNIYDAYNTAMDLNRRPR